jgi:hypothetical protein
MNSAFRSAADEEDNSHTELKPTKDESNILNEKLKQIQAKKTEMEMRIQAQQKSSNLEDYSEEERQEIIKQLKKIYYSLPKHSDQILDYQLNWDILISFNVIDSVMHKIVSRRVKEILHVEEPSLIKWVIDTLKKKPTPKFMKHNLYNVLDEETSNFVVAIWKAMIFENKKYEQGLIKEPFRLY